VCRTLWTPCTVVDSLNWKWKNCCFSGIKRICRRVRNWFTLHSSNLSWPPYYTSPSWMDISFLTITSKHLGPTGVKVPDLQDHCIVAYIALLNSWLSCKVDRCGISDSILSGCLINRTKSLWSISAGNKSPFAFSNYIPLRSCFQQYNYFYKQELKPTSTRTQHQVCVNDHRPLFRQSCETNSETWFSLKFVNVSDKWNLLKLVCINSHTS